MRRFAGRAHQDNDEFGIRRAMILVKLITPPGQFTELRHRLLHDLGALVVKRIHRFARLKIDVRILRRAPQDRTIRRQPAQPMLGDALLVDHRANNIVLDHLDFADFM